MSTTHGPGLEQSQPGCCSLHFAQVSPEDARLQNAEKIKACEKKMFSLNQACHGTQMSWRRGCLLLQTSEINAGCKITHESQECLQPEQGTPVGFS